jgi:hypothetical protein
MVLKPLAHKGLHYNHFKTTFFWLTCYQISNFNFK